MDINVIYVLDTNFGTIKMRNSFALLHIKRLILSLNYAEIMCHMTLYFCAYFKNE